MVVINNFGDLVRRNFPYCSWGENKASEPLRLPFYYDEIHGATTYASVPLITTLTSFPYDELKEYLQSIIVQVMMHYSPKALNICIIGGTEWTSSLRLRGKMPAHVRLMVHASSNDELSSALKKCHTIAGLNQGSMLVVIQGFDSYDSASILELLTNDSPDSVRYLIATNYPTNIQKAVGFDNVKILERVKAGEVFEYSTKRANKIVPLFSSEAESFVAALIFKYMKLP